MGRWLEKNLRFMERYGRRPRMSEIPALPIGIEADFVEVDASEEVLQALEELAAEPVVEEVRTRWFPVGDLLMHLPRYLDDDSCPYAGLIGRVMAEAKGQEHRLGHLQVSDPLYRDLEVQDRRERASDLTEQLVGQLEGRHPDESLVAATLEDLYRALNYSWLEVARVLARR